MFAFWIFRIVCIIIIFVVVVVVMVGVGVVVVVWWSKIVEKIVDSTFWRCIGVGCGIAAREKKSSQIRVVIVVVIV